MAGHFNEDWVAVSAESWAAPGRGVCAGTTDRDPPRAVHLNFSIKGDLHGFISGGKVRCNNGAIHDKFETARRKLRDGPSANVNLARPVETKRVTGLKIGGAPFDHWAGGDK